jgi:hypothetical protein
MIFINDWETKLNDSYAEFAELAAQAQDLDFVYGLLATAVLWPIRRAVKQYDLEAIQALQQIVGADKGGPVLSVVQRWPDDRLAAARSTTLVCASSARLWAAARRSSGQRWTTLSTGPPLSAPTICCRA